MRCRERQRSAHDDNSENDADRASAKVEETPIPVPRGRTAARAADAIELMRGVPRRCVSGVLGATRKLAWLMARGRVKRNETRVDGPQVSELAFHAGLCAILMLAAALVFMSLGLIPSFGLISN
jgi:hypothetical protein